MRLLLASQPARLRERLHGQMCFYGEVVSLTVLHHAKNTATKRHETPTQRLYNTCGLLSSKLRGQNRPRKIRTN